MEEQEQQLKKTKKKISIFVIINIIIILLLFISVVYLQGALTEDNLKMHSMASNFLEWAFQLVFIFSILSLYDVYKHKRKGKIFSWCMAIFSLPIVIFWLVMTIACANSSSLIMC